MPTTTPAMFTYPLGDDAALIPRTPAIAEAFHGLLVANQERLARWDPGACPDPLTLDNTRARLERNAKAWLDGTQLPVAIAIRHDTRWRLVGGANLHLNHRAHSAEIGYWIDTEGKGLVTRTVTALLDQAFGPLRLNRVTLGTDATNHRSRALAHRLGFTQEGLLRQANLTPDGAVYSLLSHEWTQTPTPSRQDGAHPATLLPEDWRADEC